jgi:hypothetical protein
VLYMIGFLVDKGIDVNKKISESEKYGTCTDVHSVYQDTGLKEDKPRAFVDLLNGQAAWNEANDWIAYQKWKDTHKEDDDYKDVKLMNLLWTCLEKIEDSLKSPSIYQKEALNFYNLVREESSQPVAKNYQQIDEHWVQGKYCQLMDEEIENAWRDESVEIFMHKQEDLVERFKDNYYPRKKICYYNKLRSMLGQLEAKSVKDMHENWIEKVQLSLEKWQENHQEEDFHHWKITWKKKMHHLVLENKKICEQYNLPCKDSIINPLETEAFMSLIAYNKFVSDGEGKRLVLFKYNYLRHELKLPLVTSVDAIDVEWLKKLSNPVK